MSDLIIAKEIKIADLLREGRFSVPMHQRYYDWDAEHVGTLLQDLGDAVDENSPCHFMGSIMLIKGNEENGWEINDGQQRIITYSLVCAYLCKIFEESGHSGEERNILRLLFDIHEGHTNTLSNADRLTPRVMPPQNNEVQYNSLIRGHDVGSKSNGKMFSAWTHIVSFFDDRRQDVHWLKKLIAFMMNKVVVIRLEVDKSLDANAIFETLNYRGKYLEQVDLMKNYFLAPFGNNEAEQARYRTMNQSFEDIYTNFNSRVERVSEYVRCHMQAKYGFINKERLFRETKKRFDKAGTKKTEKIFSLVDDLAKKNRVQIFKTFERTLANRDFMDQLTKDAKKTNNKRKIYDYLVDLQSYKVARPILFALFCVYGDANNSAKAKTARFVYHCAKLLSSFVQRIAHTGDFRPSAYEENFATLAMDIFKGNCSTAQDFMERLKSYDKKGIIKDANYIELIRSKIYLKDSVTKSGFVLKRIVEHQENRIEISNNRVSIEHILPKGKKHYLKSTWSKFGSDERDRLLHCLGNLTLLCKTDNSPKDKDNESFSAKKKIYSKSSYQLTRDICQYPEWSPQIVRERHSKLAKIAAKEIWNFNF